MRGQRDTLGMEGLGLCTEDVWLERYCGHGWGSVSAQTLYVDNRVCGVSDLP